jgi:hypothetical protein
MATVRFCDRHFYFSKRIDAVETGVPVEVDGISVHLDLCRTCAAAIKSWQELVRQATADGGIQKPAYNNHTPDSAKFLHRQSSA